jgi:hypothetical protein
MRSGAFLTPLIPGPLPLTKKAPATCPGLSSSCRRPLRLAKGGLPLRERQRRQTNLIRASVLPPARAEKAEATRRAYRTDLIFRSWCSERGAGALLAAFLAREAERRVRPSTIGRRVAAIRYAHKLAGLPLPTDDERVLAPFNRR